MISWINSYLPWKKEDLSDPLLKNTFNQENINSSPICHIKSSIDECRENCCLQIQSISCLAQKYFDHPFLKGIAVGAGTIVTVYSAYQLWFIYDEFTDKCLDSLNGSSTDLIACKKEFSPQITLFNALVAGCCSYIGYLLQQYLENQSLPMASNESAVEPPEKIKRLVSHLQNNYSYELNISLGYLYNGLWIDTFTRSSWIGFFTCQSAAIGIASAFLGMYLRVKLVSARILSQKRTQLLNLLNDSSCSFFRKHWSEWTLYGGGVVVFTLSWFRDPFSFTEQAILICREISLMILARPLGEFLINGVDNLNARNDSFFKNIIINPVSTILDFQAPLVSAGYYVYLASSDELLKLGGVFIIGMTHGFKDGRLEKIEVSEKIMNEDPQEIELINPQHSKALKLFKNYWKTCILVAFTITSRFSTLLACYSLDGESSNTYSCPIGFDLSGNYINIDGKGVSFMLTAAIVQYHIRSFFKYAQSKKYSISKITNKYIFLTNRFQFDMISVIPYAIIKSSLYDDAYNAYASYNPYAVLALLSVTLGTYKERVHSESDPFRPAFSQLLI